MFIWTTTRYEILRYAQIRKMDISNGEFIGASLFVQGCSIIPHCNNCFNSEAWNFDGGQEWNEETKNMFLELIKPDYIKRVTILGGEPLANENAGDVLDLLRTIKEMFPDKRIWLYTGYTWEEIFSKLDVTQREIVYMCDVLVDGRFVDNLKDAKLKWRGSSNQRVIDVFATLHESGNIITYKI